MGNASFANSTAAGAIPNPRPNRRRGRAGLLASTVLLWGAKESTVPGIKAKPTRPVTATTNELTTTATADDLTAPPRALVSALQHSLPRNEFFAGLYILACVNGLLGRSIYTF